MVLLELTPQFQILIESKDKFEVPVFKNWVPKHFTHGQTVANKPKLFHSDSPDHKNYYEVLVPLSPFLGRTVFGKDLGFVKPAHDFQNMS